jgi:hypothetical protein
MTDSTESCAHLPVSASTTCRAPIRVTRATSASFDYEEIAEERAEIERRLRQQPAEDAEQLGPKVLRRVLSGPIAIH